MKLVTVVARSVAPRPPTSGGDSDSPAQDAKPELYRGFGDALSQAFELVVTPMIFWFFGTLLDRWLGTAPVFAISLVVLALVGLFVRMWYGYDTRMRALEAGSPWAKSRSDPSSTDAGAQ